MPSFLLPMILPGPGLEKPSTTWNVLSGFFIPGSQGILLVADRRMTETAFSAGASSPGEETPANRQKTGIAKKIFIRAVVTVIHASISLSRIKGKMKTSGIHSLCRRMGTVAAQHSVSAEPPSSHVVKPGSRCRKTSPPG
ncbi:hypothetical protein [Akkermansia sp.]|uniref:hypothetical protein n=2 Tax=Akkermansia TaxID=239934 RepID=UPI003AF7CCC4